VLITGFGYHTIIPSLASYLNNDVKAIKRCILWGSAVPLVIYLLWETLILGNVPLRGDMGLAAIFQSGGSLSRTLEHRLQNPLIGYCMRTFALFAIITSFVGVAQSLFDFLRDGLKMSKSPKGRVGVWALTFAPPLCFVLLLQKEFVTVLEYAGVFVAILIGMLPIAMVVSARYVKRFKSSYRAPGGAVVLALGFAVFVAIIALVVATNAGMMTVDVTRYLAAS
jgi:tyrosine-specific transport protein